MRRDKDKKSRQRLIFEERLRRLEGKVAIVTGGASGIGRATALLFSREGAKVVVADVFDQGGKETVSMIAVRNTGESLFVHTDVSKTLDVSGMVKASVQEFGKLNVIFNNAGTEGVNADTANYPEDIFDRVIAVNLKGVWLGIKCAVPELIRSGGGSIINMSSIAGLIGGRNFSAYCASKGGVIQLTKTAALEYGRQGIRVNAIAPGDILSPMHERLVKEGKMNRMDPEAYPVGRLGKPEEIASVALFLASDESSFVTGHVLTADGGYVIQ